MVYHAYPALLDAASGISYTRILSLRGNTMRKRFRPLVVSLGMMLVGTSCLFSQEHVEFFPVSQIQPGMKGTGKTIFQGDEIEEFQVEILGVLKNATAPKHDIIIARLSGGPLERTGVIAGMSGSPVYLDGKLLGAVALSFPFAKEPLAGITPIEEMVQVVPAASTEIPTADASSILRIAPIPGSPGVGRLIPDDENPLESWGKHLPLAEEGPSLVGLRFPIRFGGFPAEILQTYRSFFWRLGFEPMQGAVLSGSGNEDETISKTDLEPGSMISLLLVRGDLNLNVDCTITYRKGDSLYACGHRFLMVGPAKIPFAASRVITAVPSLASSFKLDVPGPLMGSITQDRFGAIYGIVGEKAPLIPVHIRLDSTLNRVTDYNFEIVQQPYLSPFLLNLGVASTLTSTERTVGPSTLELKGKIQLANGEAIDLEDVISGDINTPNAAAVSATLPLTYLLRSSFPDVHIESVDLTLVSSNEKRTTTLEQAWSSQSEVAPGETIEVTTVLRTPAGETIVQKLPVEIPESVNDKDLSLVVGSGAAINAFQTRIASLAQAPRDLKQLVRALNKTRRNNRLYALLMAPQRSFVIQGDEYPSPPPSLVQTLLADPAVSSSITYSSTSIIGDFETKPLPYTIRGQRTLRLKVVENGR